MGARQLVVQDALEIIVSSFVNSCSLTPFTTVLTCSGPFAGALMRTFFAPALRWRLADSLVQKNPVDSTTISALRCFQGSFEGSFSDSTRTSLPSMRRLCSFASTLPGHFPCTLSYLKRWANVLVSVKSFTATHSISGSKNPALRTMRPILPNPLMPIRTTIFSPLVSNPNPAI